VRNSHTFTNEMVLCQWGQHTDGSGSKGLGWQGEELFLVMAAVAAEPNQTQREARHLGATAASLPRNPCKQCSLGFLRRWLSSFRGARNVDSGNNTGSGFLCTALEDWERVWADFRRCRLYYTGRNDFVSCGHLSLSASLTSHLSLSKSGPACSEFLQCEASIDERLIYWSVACFIAGLRPSSKQKKSP
jgi:hypothetical protein